MTEMPDTPPEAIGRPCPERLGSRQEPRPERLGGRGELRPAWLGEPLSAEEASTRAAELPGWEVVDEGRALGRSLGAV